MKKYNYYPAFDVLKFIAACVLVLYHFQLHFDVPGAPLIDFVYGFFDAQRLTQLFFEISGFLVALSFHNQGINQIKDLFLKMKKTILRFLPHCLLTIFSMCILVYSYHASHGEWLLDHVYLVKDIIASVFFSAQCGVFYRLSAVNGVLWYVFVLLRCYFIFYLFSLIPSKLRIMVYFLISVLGYVLYAYNSFSLLVPIFGGWSAKGFGAFFVGVLLFHLFQNVKTNRKQALGTMLLLFYGMFGYLLKSWDFILITDLLLFPGVLCFFSFTGKRNEFIPELGSVSFYIFIWHIPVLYAYAFLVNENLLPAPRNGIFEYCFLTVILLLSFFIFQPIGNKIDSIMLKHFGGDKNGKCKD